jgi:RNA polymerase sigma-70 factor, ECF subfamily
VISETATVKDYSRIGIIAIQPFQCSTLQASRTGLQPGELQDHEIIHRVLSGDVNAFEVLLKRYRSLVFGIVIKHVPRHSVEDVAQEVFVRTYQSLPGFAGKSSFRRWLATIAVRCCYDFWRNHERNREAPLSTLTDDHQNWLDAVLTSQSRETFLEQTARREGEEVLQYALDRLSAEDRMVVSLVHLEGRSVREAALLLGWGVIKTKVRAHRARREMRKIISRLIGESEERP